MSSLAAYGCAPLHPRSRGAQLSRESERIARSSGPLSLFAGTCQGLQGVGRGNKEDTVAKGENDARGELLYSLRPAHSLICGGLHERVLDRWRVLAKGECTTGGQE